MASTTANKGACKAIFLAFNGGSSGSTCSSRNVNVATRLASFRCALPNDEVTPETSASRSAVRSSAIVLELSTSVAVTLVTTGSSSVVSASTMVFERGLRDNASAFAHCLPGRYTISTSYTRPIHPCRSTVLSGLRCRASLECGSILTDCTRCTLTRGTCASVPTPWGFLSSCLKGCTLEW